MASIVDKQDYQPTETEKIFYRFGIEPLKPKQVYERFEEASGIRWNRETYKAFIPRNPYFGHITTNPEIDKKILEQYNYPESYSKQSYQEIITNLHELIKQYPDSPYYSHYKETFEFIIQMQKEDEIFYDKYAIGGVTNFEMLGSCSDVCYRGAVLYPSTVPLDEKIPGYIHYLRYSYFYKTTKYKMEFGDAMFVAVNPCTEPILSGAKLANAGIPALPAVLNILEDRRLIIAVDDPDKIPAVFYRYQDASVEILQRMFIKAKQPFPLQIPEDQYFSEYLEKQTPETKQKIINDIKAWVEESMKNPATPQEPEKQPKEQKEQSKDSEDQTPESPK